jgi:predicted DsbA family dithiol-disulfide isomerase
VAAGRRQRLEREHAGEVVLERRCFLLLPGVSERPVYDEYVISHRLAAKRAAPELPFAIPRPGQPYPGSSLPAQLVALRAADVAPARLGALEDQLYRSVFERLEDVADRDVLRRCAEAAGLDPAEVDRALAAPELRERALREHDEALANGIAGIPALLVPGARPLIGAVPYESYEAAVARGLGRAAKPSRRPGRDLPSV